MVLCRSPAQMAPAFKYLTGVLTYLFPGQATFNGLPLNQQLLLAPDESISQPLGITEANALYEVQPSEQSAASVGLGACVTWKCGAGRQLAGLKQRRLAG